MHKLSNYQMFLIELLNSAVEDQDVGFLANAKTPIYCRIANISYFELVKDTFTKMRENR